MFNVNLVLFGCEKGWRLGEEWDMWRRGQEIPTGGQEILKV